MTELTVSRMQIYDTDIIPLLLSTVRDLFDNYHVEQFIISATLRNEKTFQTFLNGCGEPNLPTHTLLCNI